MFCKDKNMSLEGGSDSFVSGSYYGYEARESFTEKPGIWIKCL